MVAAATLGVGCGGRQRNKADVSLASTPAAQAEYRALRSRFFDADARGRAALAPALRQFLASYPEDERSYDVRAYLALAELEAGEPERSEATLSLVVAGPRGSRRDFANVVRAARYTRGGRPAVALMLLDRLEGRIVDLDERYVYAEERARAAFTAHRYGAGLRALIAWLAQSPTDRLPRAQSRARLFVDLVPASELVMELRHLRQVPGSATRAELEVARAWVVDIALTRLTRLALERSDSHLANRLLEVAPPTLRVSAEGRRLATLAAAETSAPAIVGRAVGLLLALGTPLERRRASAVARGITRALGSASGSAERGRVELLVRYVNRDVDAALTELAADGAALLVAGADDATAAAVLSHAQGAEIPVLLLRPPPEPPAPGGFGFVLGLDDAAVEAELSKALAARGHAVPVRVGPGGVPCDGAAPAGQSQFPVAAWQKQGTGAWFVSGDADCARDLARELAAPKSQPVVALGLDASPAYGELPLLTLGVRAGRYPEQSAAAGFYEALGHDAGVLAAAALASLPVENVARGEDVRALHRKARDSLARLEAELWTSDARGFAGKRVLPRALSVIERGPQRP